MNQFYVYGYFEPGCSNPFYIGKGSGNRHLDHFHPSSLYHKETLFYNKLRKMLDSGIRPIIKKLFENLTEAVAIELEKKLILQYGRRDQNTGCLCNLTDGGEGGNPHGAYGCTFSFDARINISNGAKRRDRTIIDQILKEARGQPIHSIDLIAGIAIKRYASIREAAKDIGHNEYNIRKCLKGKSKSFNGVGWDYCT